ncbi:HMA2 domain-containing protein [Campylobacter gastrosuis]|uniref:Cation transporter n=1 Tax=Campylobacter gastrosuis TaxID=2974576 RepID=A0ABT7HMN2_9BACT|nr:hypothetical protein [Campylobacter gastrosuis]MDL0088185.1 hypothetical protein [Campylobacter gastrosuis]
MSITPEILIKIISYFTPISHTEGRLRVRVSPKIRELSGEVELNNIDNLISKINGIKSVKFNKIIGSVTIQYDNLIFKKSEWDELLAGKNLEILSQKINDISKDIL